MSRRGQQLRFIKSLLYRWGFRRIEKTGKHGEVEVKRIWWVLVHPPYSPQREQKAVKGTISLGCQEKRKDRKSEKSWSEEKVVGFSSASLFPARKQETVTQGGTI